MLRRQTPTRLLSQGVIGHEVQAHLALAVGLKIAKFRIECHTPLAHDGGAEGGIAVGCNVPVVRRSYFNAADSINANQRGQKARLTLIVERKSERGRCQDGYILEAKLQVFGLNAVVFFIDLQAGRFQNPFGQPAGALNAAASGVSRIANDGALRVNELYFCGLTMPATFEQGVFGLQKFALKRVCLQTQSRALEGIAFSRDLHAALCTQGVLRLVVFNSLRPHRQALFAKQHASVNHQV